METNVHRNALKSGYRLHWYQIERVLGQGGFGITYLAQDSNLDCPVAIKEYLPVEISMREATSAIYPVSGDWTQQYRWGLERFIAEARLLAKFKHPHIVRVLNVFEANNSAYMVMAYEEGESLEHILKRRKTMDEAELLTILIPILDGLEKIHQSGFIHRDVKPANIFIRTDGSPVLLDFGSARLALGEKTRTLTALYSPGYAPMEQYYSKSDLQGPWTDIYALSATLYRAITGAAPVDALERTQGILHGSTDPLKPVLELGRERYTDAFLKAIDHGLGFKPDLRPQSIAVWRQEFSAPQSSPASMPSIPIGTEGTDVDTINLAAAPPSVTDDSQRMEDLKRHREQPENLRTMSGIRRWGITVGLCVGIVSVSTLLWLNRGLFFENSTPTEPVNTRTPPLTVEPVATDEPLSTTETKVPPTETDQAKPPGAEPPTDIDVSPPQNNQQEEISKGEQINDLLAAASRDIKAGHLTKPKGNNAIEKYRAVLALQPDQLEATQGIREIVDRLLRLANKAIEHKDWAKALTHIDQAATIEPEARGVAMAREALNIRKAEYEKQFTDAQKEAQSQDPKQNVKTLIDLAMQAMGGRMG
jgi:serine/threonine protein kinase